MVNFFLLRLPPVNLTNNGFSNSQKMQWKLKVFFISTFQDITQIVSALKTENVSSFGSPISHMCKYSKHRKTWQILSHRHQWAIQTLCTLFDSFELFTIAPSYLTIQGPMWGAIGNPWHLRSWYSEAKQGVLQGCQIGLWHPLHHAEKSFSYTFSGCAYLCWFGRKVNLMHLRKHCLWNM